MFIGSAYVYSIERESLHTQRYSTSEMQLSWGLRIVSLEPFMGRFHLRLP